MTKPYNPCLSIQLKKLRQLPEMRLPGLFFLHPAAFSAIPFLKAWGAHSKKGIKRRVADGLLTACVRENPAELWPNGHSCGMMNPSHRRLCQAAGRINGLQRADGKGWDNEENTVYLPRQYLLKMAQSQ